MSWAEWLAAFLLPGVFVHLDAVRLQRSIMLRLQPLLDRLAVAPEEAGQ